MYIFHRRCYHSLSATPTTFFLRLHGYVVLTPLWVRLFMSSTITRIRVLSGSGSRVYMSQSVSIGASLTTFARIIVSISLSSSWKYYHSEWSRYIPNCTAIVLVDTFFPWLPAMDPKVSVHFLTQSEMVVFSEFFAHGCFCLHPCRSLS